MEPASSGASSLLRCARSFNRRERHRSRRPLWDRRPFGCARGPLTRRWCWPLWSNGFLGRLGLRRLIRCDGRCGRRLHGPDGSWRRGRWCRWGWRRFWSLRRVGGRGRSIGHQDVLPLLAQFALWVAAKPASVPSHEPKQRSDQEPAPLSSADAPPAPAYPRCLRNPHPHSRQILARFTCFEAFQRLLEQFDVAEVFAGHGAPHP